jgi:hypothetical protein
MRTFAPEFFAYQHARCSMEVEGAFEADITTPRTD